MSTNGTFGAHQLVNYVPNKGTREQNFKPQSSHTMLQMRVRFFTSQVVVLLNGLPEYVGNGDSVDKVNEPPDLRRAALNPEVEQHVSGVNAMSIFRI